MENKIDLGTLNLGEKGSALSGKKINLNFQLKISLNPNEDGNNFKVELLPNVEKLDIAGLKLDEANADKNFNIKFDTESDFKKVSAQKLKERPAKFGFANEETDEYDEIAYESLNDNYAQAKQNLEENGGYDDE